MAVNCRRSKAAAHETAMLAEEAGGRALPAQADITRDAEVRASAGPARDRLRRRPHHEGNTTIVDGGLTGLGPTNPLS